MLGYFFDCCPAAWDPDVEETQSPISPESSDGSISYKHLFDSLAISSAGREYLDKMGKYPVIFLSFKDTKEMDWESCLDNIKKRIQEEYTRHYYLLESPKLLPLCQQPGKAPNLLKPAL